MLNAKFLVDLRRIGVFKLEDVLGRQIMPLRYPNDTIVLVYSPSDDDDQLTSVFGARARTLDELEGIIADTIADYRQNG